MRPLALASLAVLAGCATSPEQERRAAEVEAESRRELAAELAGLVRGDTTSCLPVVGRTAVSSEGYGDAIVYRVSDDLKYVTQTSGGCEGVGRRDDILVTRTPQGRVCSGDIAQTFDRVSRFPTGGCSFGEFTAYRRPS